MLIVYRWWGKNVISYQLSVISYQLSVISYQFLFIRLISHFSSYYRLALAEG
ncbi:hypothetical protein [Microcystis sp. M38BS1]|uniref:hypothetical protein n=1 Tax=Microcystis sp. M38BS1 TaxID=2771188 RepID=UPI0031FC8463